MEQLEIVNKKTGQPTGEVLPRNEAIAQEAWVRSTNVFVLNHKGEILCHQRSMQKERKPGVWMTHLGGHVGVGETYETNALKELEEEAGIVVPAKKLISWRTTRVDLSRLWSREFVVVCDQPESELKPQPGEVDAFKWMSIEDIMRCAKNEPELWQAGTHDIASEYACMLTAIGTAHHLGVHEVPEALHTWNPEWMIATA